MCLGIDHEAIPSDVASCRSRRHKQNRLTTIHNQGKRSLPLLYDSRPSIDFVHVILNHVCYVFVTKVNNLHVCENSTLIAIHYCATQFEGFYSRGSEASHAIEADTSRIDDIFDLSI